MIEVRCEHMLVGYRREELEIDGEQSIIHNFPCEECPASVLIWDDDVNYKDIE